ncbi:uncharacterized protein BROUX77_000231 [Berkeleyomyces rouxiae]|uniref:uncharacterized protein n=1 Tax=Berkeleyomyces rouxiae TaxID=2035830 RepID=UPI003B7AABD2
MPSATDASTFWLAPQHNQICPPMAPAPWAHPIQRKRRRDDVAILEVPDLQLAMNMKMPTADVDRKPTVPSMLDLSLAALDPPPSACALSMPTSAVSTTTPVSATSPPALWAARRILPMPVFKRARTTDDVAKKQALHQQQQPGGPIKLTPCHICHRRPTKKSDLEAFMDCAGCGMRACFVCMRRCAGWAVPPPLLDSDNEESSASGVDDKIPDAALDRSFCMEDADSLSPPSAAAAVAAPAIPRAQTLDARDVLLSPPPAEPDTTDPRAYVRPCAQIHTQTQTHTPRPAHGWRGQAHCEMVCSRCCVERGLDGDVMCLGCLAGSSYA